MRERPILFSAPMVRAILDGSKTQTRRVLKPRNANDRYYFPMLDASEHMTGDKSCLAGAKRHAIEWGPYGVAGDRLWVRETFYCDHADYPHGPRDEMVAMLEYRAGHDCRNWEAGCPCRDDAGRSSWRPSIHMPRWASRIDLEITEVRVERLHEITGADVRAEGVRCEGCPCEACGRTSQMCPATETDHIGAFAELWARINGVESWDADPWVWVVSFRRVRP